MAVARPKRPRTRREGPRTTLRLNPSVEHAAAELQRAANLSSRNEALIALLKLGAREFERRAQLMSEVERRHRLWDERYGPSDLEHPEAIADEQWDRWLDEADQAIESDTR